MVDGHKPLGEIVIATAASADYFDPLLTLIASVHRQPENRRRPILCLDLGLLPWQRSMLERLEDVSTLRLPADIVAAHPHVAEPKTFAWKIWLLHHLVGQGTTFLYLDTSVCLTVRSAEAFASIESEGLLLVSEGGGSPNTIGRWTHDEACRILQVTDDERRHPQLLAGIIGAQPTDVNRMFFDEALRFALDPDCIRGEIPTHRHDQSILSVLAHRHGLPAQAVSLDRDSTEPGSTVPVLLLHRQTIRDHRGLRWIDEPGHQRGPAVWDPRARGDSNERSQLRVSFRGFWEGFDPERFFMVQRMRSICDIEVVDDGDVLFFGPFGDLYRDFVGLKVFVSAESDAVPRRYCDYSISSHFDGAAVHFRFPLVFWSFFEWPDDLALLSPPTVDEWSSRPHFCNFIFSNAAPTLRNEFFEALSRRRFVHAPGKVFTNSPPIPADGDDWKTPKRAYMRQFRFTIAFENASVDGYTTEKAIDALLTGTIPIYWGNDRVGEDLDRSRLIVAGDFESLDSLADFVCALDDDPALAVPYLQNPALSIDALAKATADLDTCLAAIVDDAARPFRVKPRRAIPIAEAVPDATPIGAAITDGRLSGPADIVVASAADSAALTDVIEMIDSLRRFKSGRSVKAVVLDLGLAPDERAALESRDRVSVTQIPDAVAVEAPHLVNVGAFAWRAWLADHLVSTHGGFLYLDPDVRFASDPTPLFDTVAASDVMVIDEPELRVGALLVREARNAVGLASFERMAGAVSGRVFGARASERSAKYFAHVLRLATRPDVWGGNGARDRAGQAIMSVLAARSGFDRQPKGRWESYRIARPGTVLLLP